MLFAPRPRPTVLSRLLVLALLGTAANCSDNPNAPAAADTSAVIVSSPTPLASVSIAQQTPFARLARSTASAPIPDEISYVSLPPGTVPQGNMARIDRLGGDAPIFTKVRDGGFNPVPIDVLASDTVEVSIRSEIGAVLYVSRIPVRPTRAPKIVRSYPPAKKTDVAINGSVVVVFSEPVESASISGSAIQLFAGSTSVAGTARVLPGSGALVAFTPTAPLASNADYQVVVSRAVTNRQGLALPNDASFSFRTGAGTTGPVAAVIVAPDTVHLGNGSYQLSAMVQDSAGNMLVDVPVTWSGHPDPSDVATVSETGLVTAIREGGFSVTATAGGISGYSEVIVRLPDAAASVTVTPSSMELPPGSALPIAATVRDASGRTLQRDVRWSSSNPSVARFDDPFGEKVWGVSAGTATITARSGDAFGTATITVAPRPILGVTFDTVFSAGSFQTCALNVAGAAYCWGGTTSNNWGTRYSPPVPVRVTGGFVFTSLATSGYLSCGLVGAGEAHCWNYFGDLATIASPTAFTSLALGAGDFGLAVGCGLATDGSAFCWGDNERGQLGDGTRVSRANAAPVGGGLKFSTIDVGRAHTCALTLDAITYCWGTVGGPFGDVLYDSLPARVAGPTFASISAGGDRTCGLTPDGVAYCWGLNVRGLLGDGTDIPRLEPTLVAGGHTFTSITAGYHVTCALDAAGTAYCWGDNEDGELGNGTTSLGSMVPVQVATTLRFRSLSAGFAHVCGISLDGILYCWGGNADGELGDGTTTNRSVPTRVVGQP